MKKLVSLFLALTILVSGLFVSTQPANAGASIGGTVYFNEGDNLLSISVNSVVHIQVWGYSGLLFEKGINDINWISYANEVQYFKLSSLHGEEIDLWNNTQNKWSNRGDNTWHRSNVDFHLFKAGDSRLWAMFMWVPFHDMRGTANAINISVTFPKGIKVGFLPECLDGCTVNHHFTLGGGYGVATSWNVIPLTPGKHLIQLEWSEEGGLFPESGVTTLSIDNGNYQFYIPLIGN